MELYRQGLNDSAIAELEGVSQSAISAWRRKLGLPPNKKKRTLKDKRHELYIKGLTDQEIADILGVTKNAITIWRYRHRLPNNNPKFKNSQIPPKKETQVYRGQPDEDRMLELYKKGYNDRQIGEEIGVPAPVVRNWRKNKGLPSLQKRGVHDNRMELYLQGYNDREIAERIGISAACVCKWRKRNGLPAQRDR